MLTIVNKGTLFNEPIIVENAMSNDLCTFSLSYLQILYDRHSMLI